MTFSEWLGSSEYRPNWSRGIDVGMDKAVLEWAIQCYSGLFQSKLICPNCDCTGHCTQPGHPPECMKCGTCMVYEP